MTWGALLSVYSGDTAPSLVACLESLAWQTRSWNSIWVVAEGTLCPNVERVLHHYSDHFADQGWTLERLPPQNGPLGFGLPACLNHALLRIPTDWVLKIDTDDINVPSRLEETQRLVELNPGAELVGAQLQEWTALFGYPQDLRTVPTAHEEILRRGRWRNPFNGPTVAFRREQALALGGYPLVGANEDYALWGRFLKAGCLTANSPNVWVHQQAGPELVQRRSTNRYRVGEAQALADLRASGWFTFEVWAVHRILKLAVRSLPLSKIQYLYATLRQRPAVPTPVPNGWFNLLEKARSWSPPA